MAALASAWLRHFQFLLWNRWSEFNDTLQEERYPCSLPSLCFSGRSEKQDGCPSYWLADTFLTSHLESLNGSQLNLTGKQDLSVIYQFCVFRVDRKTKWPLRPLIGWDIFDFSSATSEWNWTKLDRTQDLKVIRCTLCAMLYPSLQPKYISWKKIKYALS